MRTYFNRLWILAFLFIATFHIPTRAEEVQGRHLFILSGQSNMTSTLSASFQRCVEQVYGKEKVWVTMTGHPGQPIKNWVKSWTPPQGMTDPKPEANGALYDRMLQNVQHALKGEKPATVTFIWMQGEADSESGWASVYEKSFHTLLNQIKTDLGIKDINFVVGRINDYWLEKQDGKAVRDILAKLGDENDNGAWIDTDDLNQGVNPWGGYSFMDGHYPPPGYVVMGQRFAKEACKLIDPKFQPDPAIFGTKFIDSYDDVQSHAALNKPVTGTSPAPAYQADGKGLEFLTDGKFAGVGENHPAWIGFAPSDKPIELIVDLGEPMEIESIGFNTLLSSKMKAEFPNKIIFSPSEDGETFQVNQHRFSATIFSSKKELAALREKGIQPTTALVLRSQPFSNTRKIKIEIETGDQWVFIDEIVVNPK
ncbi:MAG: sialate O-acetylesterase [Verrucomicrobiota bacterium]